ncbi:MAG: anaerobic ribonucleoside-triphosphate reductase activating protein [Clostridiaceae bacterium]|nr:anaerobic ribonucleoside-triphosphate reductase activating protein [Clostridiaceae bacterium]
MRYHNITKGDMLNGDGLRAVLWVSGCSHACPGCHNPVTWDAKGGLPFDHAAKEELFQELGQDYISGLTLSGGDPLFPGNREDIFALCREVKAKFPAKTIWLYTGYEWEDVRELPVMQFVDVLVDGPYIEAVRNTGLLWRGSGNQRVIDVQKTLSIGQIELHAEPDYSI